MKIAIVGAGSVGKILATKWAFQGHEIILGTLNPPQHEALAQDLNAKIYSPADATKYADVIVLTIPFSAVTQIIDELTHIENKPVLDCTNPVKPDLSGLMTPPDSSAAEYIQEKLPKAHVFKVFNSAGAPAIEDPDYPTGKAAMFYCGNDPDARNTVKRLVEQIGFEPIAVGELKAARMLEGLGLLHTQLGFRFGMGKDFAFGILKR